MKYSVIKDIFNGVKGNRESMALPQTHKDDLSKVSDCYDALTKDFSAAQIKRINEFLEVYGTCCRDEVDFYFTEGFKIGLQIGVECFKENR